jgi:divalent metal cation (Fe/Co/Zn/Cd) transporter
MWQNYTNAVLGIAVLVVAFLGLTDTTLTWTLGILGVLIAIVGFWGGSSLGEHSTRIKQA